MLYNLTTYTLLLAVTTLFDCLEGYITSTNEADTSLPIPLLAMLAY